MKRYYDTRLSVEPYLNALQGVETQFALIRLALGELSENAMKSFLKAQLEKKLSNISEAFGKAKENAQGLEMAGAQIHGLAAILHQAPQQAGFDRIGVEAVKPILVLGEYLQDLAGVQRVAFGAAGFEGFPVFSDRGGVDGVKDQEIIGHQGVNQGSPGLFQTHRNRPAAEALAQLGHPRAKHRGLLLQRAGLDFTLADHLQAEGVFLVRPVQGQKGRKLLGGVRFGIVLQQSFGLFASKTRWLILGEGLIERPADNSGPPLSIR